MINSACERIKELESELLEKDIAYKAMMEQRDALAARCYAAEMLIKDVIETDNEFQTLWDFNAKEFLKINGEYSLARHDAELLRKAGDFIADKPVVISIGRNSFSLISTRGFCSQVI